MKLKFLLYVSLIAVSSIQVLCSNEDVGLSLLEFTNREIMALIAHFSDPAEIRRIAESGIGQKIKAGTLGITGAETLSCEFLAQLQETSTEIDDDNQQRAEP